MRERKEGFTLVEMMTVLALVGILGALASPALGRVAARAHTAAALNQFAADVAYARMLAVRFGARTEVRFLNSGTCASARGGRVAANGYSITLRTTPALVVRRTHLHERGSACLESNNDLTLGFSSRGLLLPFENRTVWALRGGARDSLSISVTGRVYRRF